MQQKGKASQAVPECSKASLYWRSMFADFREMNVLINGLHVQCSGSKKNPALVYVPGIHGCWSPQVQVSPLLSTHFRLYQVAYVPEPEWDLHNYADAVYKLLNKINVDGVHLLGESFGSLVSILCASRQPEACQSLTLVAGFTTTPGKTLPGLANVVISVMPSGIFDVAVGGYVNWCNRRGKQRLFEGKQAFPYVRGQAGRRALLKRLRLVRQVDLQGRLAEIQCPVFYLGGDADRVVPVQREVERLNGSLSRADSFAYQLFPGYGHLLMDDCSGPAVEQLCLWLKR